MAQDEFVLDASVATHPGGHRPVLDAKVQAELSSMRSPH